MGDVFVSYKAEDRRRVRPLVEALEANGYSVWWDEQIGGGSAWRQAIETELSAAKCVIVAWSKRSVGPEGSFVQDEATRAQQRRVYVPVLIDKVHLPLGFGEMQALPLTGWKGDCSDSRYQAVLAAVRRLTGEQPPVRAGEPAERPVISRRAVLASGAVAAAAVAGAGGWALLRPESGAASDSIAVLPFANLSGNPAQAYFSDGIAEELRSALARVAGLKVVGRTSSEAVRNEGAETAAKKLGVANILTGSVRQSASTIRISAQLIDGGSGLEKWSENYDREPGDIIAIQIDIAQNVARALSIALGSAVRAAISVGSTRNATAHNLFLRAVALEQSSDDESVRLQALQFLDGAIGIDPAYADAFARKALIQRGLFGEYSRSSQELRARGMGEAAANAQKAIELAPNLAIGHVALASVRAAQLNLRGALSEYVQAESLGPNDPQFLIAYSGFLAGIGKLDQALQLARRAIQVDPLNPIAFGRELLAHFLAGRYPEAIKAAKSLLVMSPRYGEALGLLGDTYFQLGRYPEAREQYALMPADHPYRLASESVLAARLGDRADSDRHLQRLRGLYGDAAGWLIAGIHTQQGRFDLALTAIERGFAARDPGIAFIRVDPWLAPLRSAPRFQAIVRKLDFPD